MEQLRALSCALLDSNAGLELCHSFEELTGEMDAFEAALMQDWCALATVVSEKKLCEPVLR